MRPWTRTSRMRPTLPALALLSSILLAMTFSAAHAEPADDAAALELARSYFQHLDNQRLDQARALMSDAIVFEDPTAGAGPIEDPGEIVKAYANTAGFANMLFDERFAFVSNGTVVFHYMASLDIIPADDSPIRGPVPVLADLVRMATVKDGKVVRHIDLAAYPELKKALKRAAEAQNDD